MTQEIRNQVETKSTKEVVELINTLIEQEGLDHPAVGPKTFNKKSKAVDRYMDLLERATQKEMEEKEKRSEDLPKVSRGWKMATIRRLILEGSVSRKALAQITGSTERNVHIMVSILSNPSRRRDAIPVIYDRKEKTYSVG